MNTNFVQVGEPQKDIKSKITTSHSGGDYTIYIDAEKGYATLAEENLNMLKEFEHIDKENWGQLPKWLM